MMQKEHRDTREIEYCGHTIEIIACAAKPESKWTIEFIIQNPDGSKMPSRKINTHSYDTKEIAFDSGIAEAKKMIAKKTT